MIMKKVKKILYYTHIYVYIIQYIITIYVYNLRRKIINECEKL